MYFKNRLLEINERLGSIVSELGLRPKLELLSSRYHLFFQRTDEGLLWRSTVSFIFEPPARAKEKEVTWENVRLGIGEVEVMAVGSNGWVHYIGDYNDQGYVIEEGNYIDSWDKAFEMAADCLRTYPLVPQGTEQPNILDDGEMARLWLALETVCIEKGIDEVLVGRDDDMNEFFEFDFANARFRIVSVDFQIQVFKDGVLAHVAEKFKQEDYENIVADFLDLPLVPREW